MANQADCIKVACDFVSLESAARCQLLADEFREQRLSAKDFPEEVLPVNVMLMHTWENVEVLAGNVIHR